MATMVSAKRPSLPFLAFGICAAIWGSTFLVIRVGNDALPALWACTLRLSLATALLHVLLFVTGGRWPKGEALKAAALYGLWEFGISLPLLYWGERVVPSGLAAVLYALCPIAASLEARAMGIERLSARKFGAAVLAFAGVAVIFWRELGQGASLLGLLAIFIAACAAPMAGLALQKAPPQSAIGSNAIGALVGVPCALLASFLLGEHQVIPSTPQQIFPVVYLAVAGSVVAFGLFAWLINRWNTTTASFLGVVVPVIAVILGAAFRHESFNPESLVGAGIVIVAVIIALRAETQSRPAHSAS